MNIYILFNFIKVDKFPQYINHILFYCRLLINLKTKIDNNLFTCVRDSQMLASLLI